MKILTSGCSFTYNAWPKFLEGHQVTNIGFPGGGNKYIADSIIHELSQNHYDLVLVMWTGLTRLDLPVTKNIKLFDDYPHGHEIGPVNYIFSGGLVGSWTSHPISKLLFENIHKIMEVDDLMLMSLLEIIKLQGILKGKNLNYYFMSYVNYWKSPDEWIDDRYHKGIDSYPILVPTIKEIDFDQWIFLNNCKDGVFELAKNMNQFQEDNWHPNDVVNKLWAEKILEYVNLH
jgi:hypothetical protein